MSEPNQPPSFDKPQQPGGQPGYPPGQPSYPPPPAPGFGYPPAPPGQGYGYPPNASGLVPDPEGSGLYLPPGVQLASVGRRIGAYFLAIPLIIGTLVIGYVVWGLIAWSKGTTPALQVLKMKCWNVTEGKVPGFGRMALREIIGRLVDGILSIITLLVSFIMFVSGQKRQSLHDLVASTTVVHDPNRVLG